jgi:glycine betaine/choline ABC-type transport system substrate-binding protein
MIAKLAEVADVIPQRVLAQVPLVAKVLNELFEKFSEHVMRES